MALVFYNSPEAPVECALETSRAPGVPEDFVPVCVFQWREDADNGALAIFGLDETGM